MSIEVLRETTQKARKEYDDDGYEWVREYIDYRGWTDGPPKPTFAEYRLLVWVKNNPKEARTIFVGQEYLKQTNKFDGQISDYRTKKNLHALCVRLKLYPTDF